MATWGLAADPLTDNRYALAGGNPVSYVEWDGHAVTPDNPVTGNPQTNIMLNSTASTSSGAYAASREAGAGSSSAVSDFRRGEEAAAGQGKASLPYTPVGAKKSDWQGTPDAHKAVQDELLRRFCTNPGFLYGDACQKELPIPIPADRPLSADVAFFARGEIYEVKPDKYDQTREGRQQVDLYLSGLNSDYERKTDRGRLPFYEWQGGRVMKRWKAGREFKEFAMDYRGHRLLVRYAGHGVAAYRPDCTDTEEGCDDDLDLDKPTTWHRASTPLRWISNVFGFGLPGVRIGTPRSVVAAP